MKALLTFIYGIILITSGSCMVLSVDDTDTLFIKIILWLFGIMAIWIGLIKLENATL